MFEYYANIHVYCPRVGVDEPLESRFFSESLIVLLPISCKTFTLNDILKVFPIQLHWRPMLALIRQAVSGEDV